MDINMQSHAKDADERKKSGKIQNANKNHTHSNGKKNTGQDTYVNAEKDIMYMRIAILAKLRCKEELDKMVESSMELDNVGKKPDNVGGKKIDMTAVACSIRASRIDRAPPRIISIGWNGVTGPYDADDVLKYIKSNKETKQYVKNLCSHAEVNALVYAENLEKVRNATVYLTNAPCNTCAHLLISANVTRVIFLNWFGDAGIKWFQLADISCYPTSLRTEVLDCFSEKTNSYIERDQEKFTEEQRKSYNRHLEKRLNDEIVSKWTCDPDESETKKADETEQQKKERKEKQKRVLDSCADYYLFHNESNYYCIKKGVQNLQEVDEVDENLAKEICKTFQGDSEKLRKCLTAVANHLCNTFGGKLENLKEYLKQYKPSYYLDRGDAKKYPTIANMLKKTFPDWVRLDKFE